MSDKLSRRGLITSGTAGALGVLALTGCTPARRRGRPARPHGPRDATSGGDCWTFDTVWRPHHEDMPKMGYNRAARAIFKLARLWREHPDSDGGSRRPTVAQLRELIEREDFDIKDIHPRPTGTLQDQGLWPPPGTDGDDQFSRLWRLLRDAAQGMFLLAGHGQRHRQWLLCPIDSGGGAAAAAAYLSAEASQPAPDEEDDMGPREDGLSPVERRALAIVVETME